MEPLIGILVAMAAISILQGLSVSGELTILRGPSYYSSYRRGTMSRNLSCVSEDDSSAIAWNGDIDWNSAYNFSIPIDPFGRSVRMECSLNGFNNCTKEWSSGNNWTLTNSNNKPMGPVLDRRWEVFRQYRTKNHLPGILTVDETGAISISIRAKNDAYLLLCNDKHSLHLAPCIRILIGGIESNESVISKCRDGDVRSDECWEKLASRKHDESPLSPLEWRTFILKWNESSQSVRIYDERELLLSHNFTEWNKVQYLYFSSIAPALYRLHMYRYLHATSAGQMLQTPEFSVRASNFDVNMLVGLCAGCGMDIIMLNNNQSASRIGHVKSKQNTRGDGLPMWQYVKFNVTVNANEKESVRLQAITILSKPDPNPVWTVANVRIYKDNNDVRQLMAAVSQVKRNEKDEYFWPEVGCQKLSYNGSSLVSSTSPISSNSKHAMPLCASGRVGPHCAMNCSSFVNNEFCRDLAVCTNEGCSCAQGLRGENCDKDCEKDTYGFNCEMTCGRCDRRPCDIVTGTCPDGCEGNYLPPYCKTTLPPVRNLQVFETNIDEGTLLLTWLPPDLPSIGELGYYQLALCTGQSCSITVTIPLDEYCEQWKDYICYKVDVPNDVTAVKVWATHKYTREAGSISTIYPERPVRVLEPPRNMSLEVLEHGVVNLKWTFSSRNNSLVKSFLIRTEVLSTDLRTELSQQEKEFTSRHVFDEHHDTYTERLYLLPSTTYNFSVAAITSGGKGLWSYIGGQTPPDLGLTTDISAVDPPSNNKVQVNLRSVTNQTIHTIIHVIVKGKIPCEDYTPVSDNLAAAIKLADSNNAWIATTFMKANMEEQSFIIGDDQINNGVHNCALESGETYSVVVVVEDGESPTEKMAIVSKHYEVTLPRTAGCYSIFQEDRYALQKVAKLTALLLFVVKIL